MISDMCIIHVYYAGEEKQKEGCIQRTLVERIEIFYCLFYQQAVIQVGHIYEVRPRKMLVTFLALLRMNRRLICYICLKQFLDIHS